MATRETFASIPREEPEKILKWREEQKLRLELKGNLYVYLRFIVLLMSLNS